MRTEELLPPLPPGFVADPPLPPGFVLDEPPRSRFDVTTARPVEARQSSGFDLATARPVATGLAPRTGFAAVPTAEEVATGAYAAPPAVQPREPTVTERVTGAVEAALELFTQAAGAIPGMVVGGVEGVGESIAAGKFGTPDGAQMARLRAEQRAEQGAVVGRKVAQLLNPASGPDAKRRILAGGDAEAPSPAAEEWLDKAQGAINSLPAAGGVYGTVQGPAMMAAPGARQVAGQSLEGPVNAIRSAAEKVAERARPVQRPTAGTAASAGAAGTDAAMVRRERAASLPRPVPLTKGDATRETGQQQFERDIAKDAEAGREVRALRAEQDARVAENFDILEEQTGAQQATPEGAGSAVVEVLEKRRQRKLDAIRAEYEKARQAGETAEQVPTDEIVQLLNESRSSERNAGVIGTAADELVRQGGAVRDANGFLLPGTIDINALEEIRKTVGVGGKKDATNSLFAGKIRDRIDAVLDDVGGDVYQGARKLYASYAKEFSDQGVLRDLLATKKGTSDRTVAMERVYRRAVGEAAPVQDLRNLRRTLQAEGRAGRQAWAELQGEAIRQLREATFRTRAKNERGMKLASDAGLNNALKQLDKNGKLDELFGKQGAQTLRDLGEVVADVYTPTVDVTNPSGTGAYIKRMLIDLAAGLGAGVPAPFATISKFVSDWRQGRKTRRAVGEALAQFDAQALERRADVTARPFELPPGAEPDPAPVGRAGTVPRGPVKAAPADPRLAEIAKLKEGATPEIVRVLDDEAKRIEGELRAAKAKAARAAEVTALEAKAQQTRDPAIRRALQARANELRTEKIPAGEVRELPLERGSASPARPLPVGEVRELSAEQAQALKPSRRERDLLRLREQTTDADVIRDLDAEIAKERNRQLTRQRGEEFLRLADQAEDPELRRQLEKKAAQLGAQRESIPVGEATELSATDAEAVARGLERQTGSGAPIIRDTAGASRPTAITGALTPEQVADWQRAHGFGILDAKAAKDVAKALQYDPDAVARAARQHQRSTRAFEREIRRIIEMGDSRES